MSQDPTREIVKGLRIAERKYLTGDLDKWHLAWKEEGLTPQRKQSKFFDHQEITKETFQPATAAEGRVLEAIKVIFNYHDSLGIPYHAYLTIVDEKYGEAVVWRCRYRRRAWGKIYRDMGVTDRKVWRAEQVETEEEKEMQKAWKVSFDVVGPQEKETDNA